MNPVEQNAVAEEGSDKQIEWEMRPGGMLVQRRENGGDEDGGPLIKIKVSYGSSLHEFTVPWQSTFGELKKLLTPETGLEPGDQRLYFRGREKDDTETLHMAGLKDLSKLLLMEHHSSKERKMEEARKKDEISKACEAVSEIRAEVDKLSQKVTSLQASVNGGTKVDEKEFIISTELLMVQLLKLDSIEAEGEAKTQRKNEAIVSHLVQSGRKYQIFRHEHYCIYVVYKIAEDTGCERETAWKKELAIAKSRNSMAKQELISKHSEPQNDYRTRQTCKCSEMSKNWS